MRHVGRIWCSSLAGLAVTCGAALAQAPAAGAPPPSFPAQVEIITVDAVAVDGKGQPVTDLTQDDFVVQEDGHPQEIVSFERVSLPPEPAGAPKAAEPASITTNAGTARPAGRVFALIADDLRLPGDQTQRLHDALVRFIDQSLGPGDSVLLGTTSDETWWVTRIPEGREDLHRVLDRMKGRFVDPGLSEHMSEYEAFDITQHAPDHPPVTTSAIASSMSIFERVVMRVWDLGLCGHKDPDDIRPCWPYVKSSALNIDSVRRQRVSRTLAAMGRAIGALPTGPVRAAVVLFSPGFINDDLPRDLATAALRNRAAIYFVDVRGLETGIVSAAERTSPRDNENPGDATQKQFEKLNLEAGGAEALAEETGGFSVRNNNDLAAAGEKIAAESRTFYLLGIQPPPGKRPDAWRKLRVSVRRDGITVRARRGYRQDAATATARASTPIPLRLASYIFEPVADRRTRVVAVAEIDTTGLTADLQMRLEAMPRDGGKAEIQDLSLSSSPGATGWRSARVELQLAAGVHGLRLLLRDPTSGRTGAVEQRLVVPEAGAFRLTTPVLSDQVAASSSASDAAVAALPVAHDAFLPRPDRPLLAAFEVFGATAEAGTGERRIESEFALKDSTGRALAAAPAARLAPSPEGRWQQLIALPTLPNGDYDLSITVRDRVTGSERTERQAFKIAGGPERAAREAEPAPPVSSELAALLERTGRYVLAYESEFSSVLAEEECRQEVRSDDTATRALRFTKGNAFFVTLPGALPWTTFRDVWEVDGNRIRNREERLARLFQETPGNAVPRARAILEESGRYNLGPHRTVNVPTLALLFLLPANQHHFKFEIKGRERVQGTLAVELAFQERLRPALVAGDTAQGAPATGRMWIDPERGAVLKTDVTYDVDPLSDEHKAQARIITDYRREPRLGLLVPDRMRETYDWTSAPVHAETRYSQYHRFGVTTDETYRAETPAAPSDKPREPGPDQ